MCVCWFCSLFTWMLLHPQIHHTIILSMMSCLIGCVTTGSCDDKKMWRSGTEPLDARFDFTNHLQKQHWAQHSLYYTVSCFLFDTVAFNIWLILIGTATFRFVQSYYFMKGFDLFAWFVLIQFELFIIFNTKQKWKWKRSIHIHKSNNSCHCILINLCIFEPPNTWLCQVIMYSALWKQRNKKVT